MDNPWKEAIEEACISNCISFDETISPLEMLARLCAWETQVALDPSVSSEARALIDRGRSEYMAQPGDVECAKGLLEALVGHIDADHQRGLGDVRSATTQEAISEMIGFLHKYLTPGVPDAVVETPEAEQFPLVGVPSDWRVVPLVPTNEQLTSIGEDTLLATIYRKMLDHAPKFQPPLYRHKKTGGIYELLGTAIREFDHETVAIYRSLRTGVLWVRRAEQFNDGRFEVVS